MELIKEFNISTSAYGIYEACTWRWSRLYDPKFKIPVKKVVKTRALKLGILMHSILEDFYKYNKDIKWSKQWLLDAWDVRYKKEFTFDFKQDDFDEGKTALKTLHKIIMKRGWNVPPPPLNGVEVFFKFLYRGHSEYLINATGKIDLILKINGEILVIDWKTGSNKVWEVHSIEDSLQLILYSAALKKTLGIDKEKLYLVYFYTDTVKEFIVENKHFLLIRDKINTLLDGYKAKKYKRTGGIHCNWCEFKDICLEIPKTKI